MTREQCALTMVKAGEIMAEFVAAGREVPQGIAAAYSDAVWIWDSVFSSRGVGSIRERSYRWGHS